MGRVDPVEVIRRKSLAHAVDCLAFREAFAWGSKQKEPNPWLRIHESERQPFFEGRVRIPLGLRKQLELRFPRAFLIYDSPIWSSLEPDRSSHWLKLQLHRAFAVGVGERDTREILDEISQEKPIPSADELEAVGLLICSLRLARLSRDAELSVRLALVLARAVLRLLAREESIGAAREVWNYCDNYFLRGLKRDGMHLRFAPNTWAIFEEHSRYLRFTIREAAFCNPYGTEFPPQVMRALLEDMIQAFANIDHTRAEFFLREFPRASPTARRKLEAAESGMWREQLDRFERAVVRWRF